MVVNGRAYLLPAAPVVGVCLDGCDERYFEAALAGGDLPAVRRMERGGVRTRARGALPSFTNVNNVSLVTGVPPSVHGISGNFFLDPETGETVMMNHPRFLRVETLLASAARAGRRVAVVTAKEKLRRLLSDGLKGIAVSTEFLDQAHPETHGVGDLPTLLGRPTPPIYSADASLAVLDLGIRLLETGRADFLYLSLTDYIQHRHAPVEPEAIAFIQELDRRLGRLLDLGAVLGATADHGMNAKHGPDGTPRVLYLETVLRERFGDGARVVLPITDPYVVHHGALGACASVYLAEPRQAAAVAGFLGTLPGITDALPRADAARRLELPADRIGDVVALSDADTVLGRRLEDHDLSVLEGPLRSHGGRDEATVPFLLSRPLQGEWPDLRNFDLFAALLQ